jgi:hypothetical protein
MRERDPARLTPLRAALWSAVCVAATACATPPDQATQGLTVRDSAGVEIVEHSAEYIAALPRWTIDSVRTVRIDRERPVRRSTFRVSRTDRV